MINLKDLIATSDVPIILSDNGEYYELDYTGTLRSGLDDSSLAILVKKTDKLSQDELYEL